ncbi:MAG TPA: 2-C-methyl-D-erythritol 4-phosphate cytidylyltransferase [Acidimicrobiales bacterium]|nr:2-C-methyl-D-erythritol 4-phosphate cytidylyltransferase [Acidimicrobiales bacterium]
MWTIVVGGGSGARFGGPKQLEVIGSQRMIDLAVAVARNCSDGVVAVVPAGTTDPVPRADAVVTGGATRSASVRSGLAAVPSEVAVVVVHDAARPLATESLFRAVIDAVRAGADAAIPGLPVADTLKRVEGDRVADTVDRRDLVQVQTPQAFRARALRDAHATEAEATDDAALVEAAGGRVVVVAGDARNLKITTPDDLAIARALLR